MQKSLAELLEEKNISQSKLAKMLGVNASTVSNYVRGKRKPDLDIIVKLSQVLDLSIAQAVNIFLSSKHSYCNDDDFRNERENVQ